MQQDLIKAKGTSCHVSTSLTFFNLLVCSLEKGEVVMSEVVKYFDSSEVAYLYNKSQYEFEGKLETSCKWSVS